MARIVRRTAKGEKSVIQKHIEFGRVPEAEGSAAKGSQEFMVGSKPVEIVSDTLKKNPNSLRLLLGLLVNVGFEGKRVDAGKRLADYPPVYAHEKKGQPGKRLNNKAIGAILSDDVHIAYWQLEVFSRHFGMPVGALLLLSRLVSHLRDGELAKADVDISGSIRFAEVMKRVRDTMRLTEADLREIAASYPREAQIEIFRGD